MSLPACLLGRYTCYHKHGRPNLMFERIQRASFSEGGVHSGRESVRCRLSSWCSSTLVMPPGACSLRNIAFVANGVSLRISASSIVQSIRTGITSPPIEHPRLQMCPTFQLVNYILETTLFLCKWNAEECWHCRRRSARWPSVYFDACGSGTPGAFSLLLRYVLPTSQWISSKFIWSGVTGFVLY